MTHYTSEGPMTDVMVDIETTGTHPDRNAMIQLSAVKFNLHERKICSDIFNMSLTIPNHRCWEESTRTWWSRDKKELFSKIMASARPHEEVLKEFFEWAKPLNSLKFWSKPTHFDFMFLASYFKDAGMNMPCHFREANDLNTFIRALYKNEKVPDLGVKLDGVAHNAIDDVFFQIKLLMTHCDNVELHKRSI